MSHFITVPTNENGVYFDPTQGGLIDEAVADSPFAFQDFFLYSHGWSTDADQSMVNYSQFSVELARQILILGALQPPPFANPPSAALGVGLHWPSEITEDPNSPLNAGQLFTFYTMEHRADAVGKNAAYAILRQILRARAKGSALSTRLYLLGHSFGCKVICAALQDLQVDIAGGTISVPDGTTFRVVLLEPATDNDNLEATDIYGAVSQIADLRILITKSAKDVALGTWYPLAGRAVNLFNPRAALGSAGPTPDTVTAFGGSVAISVDTGFSASALAGVTSRLVVADLTPVHEARVAQGDFTGGGFAGSHSDIYFSEVYNMVCGFLFS
jgi:hypothetical protein